MNMSEKSVKYVAKILEKINVCENVIKLRC